ncbi:MAG: T9SS type A sorting domain-containing protein, partial [Ignavibacteria bacterium]|nr:T9SS type A sorting domain-containing protein [Ignavibacteria bacterium]
VNSEIIFAAGELGTIVKTTNSGVNWITLNSGTNNTFVNIFFSSPLYGTAVGLNGVIQRTTNGGNNWLTQNSGVNLELTGVYFVNDLTGFISGFSGTILKTTDGGVNWYSLSAGTSNDLRAICFEDENTGAICGMGGKILRTTDGGSNWTTITRATTNGLYSVTYAGSNLFICGNNIVMRSTDGGTNWEIQPAAVSGDLYSVSFFDSQNGIAAGQNGMIFKTTSGGIGITQISGVIPEKFSLKQNYPNPFNPETKITFEIPAAMMVSVEIFDVTGKHAAKTETGYLKTGVYEITLDGSGLSSGVYFCRVSAGNQSSAIRMVVVK